MTALQPSCQANHPAPYDVENETEQKCATVTVMDRASSGWYMGFQTVFIHHGTRTVSEALTYNQSSVCLCQVKSANFQLRKNWILDLIFGGFCQEESSGVFLSMGRNAFSSPKTIPQAFPITHAPWPCCQEGPSLEITDRWRDERGGM